MTKVTVRREMSTFDALSLPIQFIVIGTVVTAGLVLLVPFLIAVEIKAWWARHRIRKEEANRQAMGL